MGSLVTYYGFTNQIVTEYMGEDEFNRFKGQGEKQIEGLGESVDENHNDYVTL